MFRALCSRRTPPMPGIGEGIGDEGTSGNSDAGGICYEGTSGTDDAGGIGDQNAGRPRGLPAIAARS